jgi:hypothetical protein
VTGRGAGWSGLFTLGRQARRKQRRVLKYPHDLIALTVGDFDYDGWKHCRVTPQKYPLFALA